MAVQKSGDDKILQVKAIVFAGSKSEFQDWVQRQDQKPSEYKHCYDPSSIAGVHGVKVHLVGHFWINPAFLKAREERRLLLDATLD
jgi:hypothetical protein